MTDTYTLEEIRQAMRELGHGWLANEMNHIAEQADKNRIVRKSATEYNIPEFTEEQVRTALAGALVWSPAISGVIEKNHHMGVVNFVDDIIHNLRKPAESFEEGAVYRSRLNTVWQRSGNNWLKPGVSFPYPDDIPARPLVKI